VAASAAGTVIARTVHGLEWVCAAEVSSLIGAEDRVELSRREVTFEFGALGPGLLGLRTADDVHLKVGAVQGVGSTKEVPPAVGHAAAALDWESAVEQLRAVRQIPDAVRFDVVASLEGQRSYNRYAVEAAIGSSLAAVLRGVFLERAPSGAMTGDPDLTVRVFVRGDQAVLAVRLGPRPLHRRAYKTDTGPGTLHPPAAAALAMISAPETGTLLDPFCGDGTIAIEAAVIRPKLRVVASDFDPQRVENTRRNAGRAGVDIKVSCADAGALSTPHGAVDAVLTNPPWNLAVDWSGQLSANGQRFWDMLPSLLAGTGILCTVTDAGLDVPERLARGGWAMGLQQQLRLAGRLVHLLLASPPGAATAQKPPAEMERWRQRALRAGVVTEHGF